VGAGGDGGSLLSAVPIAVCNRTDLQCGVGAAASWGSLHALLASVYCLSHLVFSGSFKLFTSCQREWIAEGGWKFLLECCCCESSVSPFSLLTRACSVAGVFTTASDVFAADALLQFARVLIPLQSMAWHDIHCCSMAGNPSGVMHLGVP
jgi:hypothetical protein